MTTTHEGSRGLTPSLLKSKYMPRTGLYTMDTIPVFEPYALIPAIGKFLQLFSGSELQGVTLSPHWDHLSSKKTKLAGMEEKDCKPYN